MSAVVQEMDAGVAGYADNAGPTIADQVRDASAVRWLFNPAAKIDVRDRVVGYEPGPDGVPVARRYVRAGTLTPVRNVTYNAPPRDAKIPPPAFGNPAPRTQRLVPQTKYAFEVAEELTFAYASEGLVAVSALTGVEDERAVAGIVRLLFGGKIRVATDPLLPGEIVPVIPAMMESLRHAPARIAEAFADKPDSALQARVSSAGAELLASCRAGLAWARSVTDESRRLLKSRTPNGGTAKIEYDDRDRRAFLALGEPVPAETGQPAPVVPQPLPDFAPVLDVMMKQAAQIERLTATVEQLQSEKAKGGKGRNTE